jgi:hypothetical protein
MRVGVVKDHRTETGEEAAQNRQGEGLVEATLASILDGHSEANI